MVGTGLLLDKAWWPSAAGSTDSGRLLSEEDTWDSPVAESVKGSGVLPVKALAAFMRETSQEYMSSLCVKR